MRDFLWWRVNEYGMAQAYPDTPEIRKRVDTEKGWYGNVEGIIVHGGVIATAFERRTEQLYDAVAWFERGEYVPAGTRVVTKITAERKT